MGCTLEFGCNIKRKYVEGSKIYKGELCNSCPWWVREKKTDKRIISVAERQYLIEKAKEEGES